VGGGDGGEAGRGAAAGGAGGDEGGFLPSIGASSAQKPSNPLKKLDPAWSHVSKPTFSSFTSYIFGEIQHPLVNLENVTTCEALGSGRNLRCARQNLQSRGRRGDRSSGAARAGLVANAANLEPAKHGRALTWAYAAVVCLTD